jgi:hypothetical protein
MNPELEDKTHFVEDFVEYLRADLVAAGFLEASKLTQDEVGPRYFSLQLRHISSERRRVCTSSLYGRNFPQQHQLKVRTLIQKIERGADLLPYQSRALTKKKVKANDGMLNDWGINHLHLHPDGTDTLLFCHVRPGVLYAIGFWPHDNWVNTDIVEALISQWPELFVSLKGVTVSQLTAEERQNLRDKNGNAAFLHTNGQSYCALGGGTTGAGTNFSAELHYHRRVLSLTQWEKAFLDQVDPDRLNPHVRWRLEFENLEPKTVLNLSTGKRFPIQFSSPR